MGDVRRALGVLALVALGGCYLSHERAPREDAGERPDAGRDGGRDAAPARDAGRPCVSGIEWIDRVPLFRPMDAVIGPSLAASEDGFELAYRHASPELCDGPCPAALRVPPAGPQPDVREAHPMYWADWGSLSRVEVRADRSEQAWFFAIGDGVVGWAREPEPGWTAAAHVMVPREVGDVAVGRERVWIETHDVGPAGQALAMRVAEHAPSGDLIADHDASALTHGFEYRAPVLRTMSSGELWIAFTQDVDFPPTVQLARLEAGPEPWIGSSCGVDAYDVAPVSDMLVYVIERCRERVVMELRRGRFGVDLLDVSSEHHATGAPRIARWGTGAVAAFWHADGTARVHLFDRAVTEVASDAVPGSALRSGETPGPLAVASRYDNVLAVVWTHLAADGAEVPSYGAVQRFRLCE